MIYLDNAATTLRKPRSVVTASVWALRTLASPGRGGHVPAMRAADAAFRTREAIARLFHVPEPDQVVFCMNATHALNIAIKNYDLRGKRVVISGYEHNAVLRPLYAAGADIVVADSALFDREGTVAAFDRCLTEDTALAVVNHVSNVFGFVLPVREICDMCRARAIPCIVDASQSAGSLELDFEQLGATFVAMPGHKGLYGPQGTGILLCGTCARPLMEGGSGSSSRLPVMPEQLPDRLEAGTHNMPGIAGLYEGVRFVMEKGVRNIGRHERKLVELAAMELQKIPGVVVYADPSHANQSGVLSLNLEGAPSEWTAARLSERGIATRAGLHCAPLAHKSAGTDPGGTVRVSFSAFSHPRDVWYLIHAVRHIARRGT